MISFVSSLRIMIVINQTIDDRKSGSMMVQIFSTLPLGELKRLYVDHASTIVDIKCCFANYQATRELEKSEIPSVGRWTSLHLRDQFEEIDARDKFSKRCREMQPGFES